MPPDRKTGFAALLRQIIVHDRNRTLKDIAVEIGLSSRNFYGRVTGRIQFSPDEIRRVLRAVPDPRLGEWLLAQSNLACVYRVAPAPDDPTASTPNLALNGLEEVMAALRSVLQLEAAPTDMALAEAEQHIQEAQRQLGALQTALRDHRGQPHLARPVVTQLADVD